MMKDEKGTTISTTCKHGKNMLLEGCQTCENDFSASYEAGRRFAKENIEKLQKLLRKPNNKS